MPAAPARPCAGSCGQVGIWSGPRCPACAQAQEATRRTRRVITYSETWWRRWRRGFVVRLVAAGINPECGATMPGGPATNPSECRRLGLRTVFERDRDMHLHHEPELTVEEQADRSAVCDELRIVALCAPCHNRLS